MAKDLKTQALLLGLPCSNLWARVCKTLKIQKIEDLKQVDDGILLSVVGVKKREIQNMREFFGSR